MGYTINEDVLMVGLTVSGKVSGYTKGKALIKLDGSKLTGIMSPNDVEGIDRNEPIEKSMRLGTNYPMKITELSLEGKKLIRLSTL
jgi:ribosomal protein S1